MKRLSGTDQVRYNSDMETDLKIDVAALDEPHRRALEEVIGRQLVANQRLIISITELDVSRSGDATRLPQTLADWTGVYNGLSEKEIEEIDEVAKSRANLTRDLP